MNLQVVDSLGEPVGRHWQRLQNARRGTFRVAAPLSGTPLPIYEWIVAHAREFDWNDVEFVLMDELVENGKYVSHEDPASYERFAEQHFLGPLGRDIPVIKPELENISLFDVEIDLLILAIGVEGNYANVMPGTLLQTGWQIAQLTPAFREVHTSANGAYESAEFREFGMSLGPQQVMSAKHVLVIASGGSKGPPSNKLRAFQRARGVAHKAPERGK